MILKERRKSGRIMLNQQCWLDAKNLTLFIRICNISKEGMFLKTASPLPPGTRATLSWESGEKEKIEAEVEVMWTRPASTQSRDLPGMGLKILNFTRGAECFKEVVDGAEELSTDVIHMS